MNTIKETLEKLANLRVEAAEIKDEGPSPLGEETKALMPEDIVLMFAGKLVNELLKQSVASRNMLAGYKRAYGEIYPGVEVVLEEFLGEFLKGFDSAKKQLVKIGELHPLSERLCRIKGFTPYQLALVMSHIKDIRRFDTPSKLMVYAGVGVKYGLKVCKKNMNKIRQIQHERYTGDPEDYTEFGYNTALQGRMYVISDSLLRSKGFFYDFYQGIRTRLEERAINNNEVFICTAEQAKGTKMKIGEYYMSGRNTQSLAAWSNSNAKARVQRTILHLIYKEWRELRGLPCRNPYPIDYLGHSQYITLDDVLRAEVKEKEEAK